MKRFCTVLFSAAVLLAAVLSASCSDGGSSSSGGGGTAQVPGGGDTSGAELSAPTGLYATAASSSSVKLTWNSVSDATEYLIYKSKNSSNSSASFVGSTALTSKTVTGLEADTTYFFWVKAANSTTTSDFSSSEYVTTTGKTSSSDSGDSGTTTTLSAPTGLYATAESSSSIRLTWNSVSGATEYLIYKSKNSSNSSASLVGSTTLTSKTVTGLEANTKYYFWVKAANNTTTSGYSLFDYATTEAASSSGGGSGTTTTLSAPTGVTAFEDSSSRIRLSWNSVKGATGYEVYSSIFSSPSYASLYTTTTSTSAIISGNNANTTYYFWVKATNGTTKSNWSSYDYVTTKGSSSSQSKGTLTVINNSSYAIKNMQMYTTYNASLSGVLLGLDVVISPGDSKTFTNITPGTYVRLGSETYRSHKVSAYKTVTVNSGSATTLTITNSDIISN